MSAFIENYSGGSWTGRGRGDRTGGVVVGKGAWQTRGGVARSGAPHVSDSNTKLKKMQTTPFQRNPTAGQNLHFIFNTL